MKPSEVTVMMIFWLRSPSANGPPRIRRSSSAGSFRIIHPVTTSDARK